ncbi:hypothetical protein FQN54_001058 [Arachnomyces sp. PD_36]|nr:hypothetical protein FQN54_001058 [Arachnomyces sp. PD_36]
MGSNSPSSASPLLQYQDLDAHDALGPASDTDSNADDRSVSMRDDDGSNEYPPDHEMGNITRVFSSRGSSKPFRSPSEVEDTAMEHATDYKVYKRRFFGLGQLVLLNVVVSWDWLTFSAVSTTASEYFGVTEGAINWMSTGFLFAFSAVSPVVIWTLNKGGTKTAIIITATLILLGNWVRYAGTRANGGNFGVAMFGQILIGFAQPFCLCAPTRFSDQWFSDRGRTSATAFASLANPLGGALGQLIGPILATKADEIPNLVLYIAIISTVASIPALFIPANPPTPPSASAASPKIPLMETITKLSQRVEFWFIFAAFSVYVGLFNSVSSLLNQILSPHNFSETEAGITGGILILVGLISAAIFSPITDRHKHYLWTIKVLVPIIAASYVGLIFAPRASGIIPSYVVAAILGGSSFALLPVTLEFLVEITYPLSIEVGSTACWTGGQILGAIFIIAENALKAPENADPPRNMSRALIFQAVFAAVTVPLPLCVGFFGMNVKRRRLEADQAR